MRPEPVRKITRMPMVGDIVTFTTGGCYTNNPVTRYGYLADVEESVAVIVFDDWERQFVAYPFFFQTTEVNVGDLGLPRGEVLAKLGYENAICIPNEYRFKFVQWILDIELP